MAAFFFFFFIPLSSSSPVGSPLPRPHLRVSGLVLGGRERLANPTKRVLKVGGWVGFTYFLRDGHTGGPFLHTLSPLKGKGEEKRLRGDPDNSAKTRSQRIRKKDHGISV